MLPPYDFAETLSRLDDIARWLDSLGFDQPDRVRIYRRNIDSMLTAQEGGGIDVLQQSIPFDDAREVLWSYVDADEFVRAVAALRNALGDDLAAAPIQKALSGPADLFLENANNSAGRNFMFELVMAGRLAGAGFRPDFDKGPDVQTTFAGLSLAIQCKRPFSSSGLEGTIRKAIKQLKQGSAELNIIAVSASRLLNSGDPYNIPEVPHPDHGHAYMKARILDIAQETKRFWSGKLHRAGILFYGFTPFRCSEGPQYNFDRYESLFPLDADELTIMLLKSFAQSLRFQNPAWQA